MHKEYAVEIYNKYLDSFVEQLDIFPTEDDARKFIKIGDFDFDVDSEVVGILEIEYNDAGEEIGTMRIEIDDKDDMSLDL